MRLVINGGGEACLRSRPSALQAWATSASRHRPERLANSDSGASRAFRRINGAPLRQRSDHNVNIGEGISQRTGDMGRGRYVAGKPGGGQFIPAGSNLSSQGPGSDIAATSSAAASASSSQRAIINADISSFTSKTGRSAADLAPAASSQPARSTTSSRSRPAAADPGNIDNIILKGTAGSSARTSSPETSGRSPSPAGSGL